MIRTGRRDSVSLKEQYCTTKTTSKNFRMILAKHTNQRIMMQTETMILTITLIKALL